MDVRFFMASASVIRALQSPDRLVRATELVAHTLPRSQGGSFPAESIDRQRAAGLIAPLSRAFGGCDLGLTSGTTQPLLRILATIGRADLSLGRIYEGHVNALQLIDVFGTRDQRSSSAEDGRKGHVFGVWNTDAPECPVTIRSGPSRRVILKIVMFSRRCAVGK